jgi:hypothetical protein
MQKIATEILKSTHASLILELGAETLIIILLQMSDHKLARNRNKEYKLSPKPQTHLATSTTEDGFSVWSSWKPRFILPQGRMEGVLIFVWC